MVPPHSNSSTYLPFQMSMVAETPDLSVAYAVASAAERALAKPAEGYRLYWMAAGCFGSCDVPVDPMAFIVVGRHSLCDVVLDADPTIALRHLLVRATRLDDGCPRLSVVDLHTHLGFEMNGEHHERAMAATGPIAFRVGTYALIGLPGGEKLPDALPKPEYTHAAIKMVRCASPLPNHPYRDAPVSSITLLPPALVLTHSQVMARDGYTVSLRGANAAATVQLSATDLDVGVLVGRAPKCNDLLRHVLNDGISRVHLLLRHGVAYDLASTQGTYAYGRRIRSTPFADGTHLSLGTANVVHMLLKSTA